MNTDRVGSRRSAVGGQVGSRQWVVGSKGRLVRIVFPALCLLPTAHFLTGCADDQPANSDPTQKAMQDPMNYKPDFERRDAASEGRNQPDGLGKDLDHVLNP